MSTNPPPPPPATPDPSGTSPPPPPPPGPVAAPPAPTYTAVAPDHPRATVALILGILGIVACSVVAPFALVIGRRSVTEIDASGGRLGGRGMAQAGFILGVIGTVILALSLIGVVAVVIVAAANA